MKAIKFHLLNQHYLPNDTLPTACLVLYSQPMGLLYIQYIFQIYCRQSLLFDLRRPGGKWEIIDHWENCISTNTLKQKSNELQIEFDTSYQYYRNLLTSSNTVLSFINAALKLTQHHKARVFNERRGVL